MSLIKVAQNIELERDNNKTLREAMDNRMLNLLGSIDSLHSQVQAQAQMLIMLREDVAKAQVAMLQEMADRDEALRVIIEGDNYAGE